MARVVALLLVSGLLSYYTRNPKKYVLFSGSWNSLVVEVGAGGPAVQARSTQQAYQAC